MARRILIILSVVLSVNSILFAQEIKFTDHKDTYWVEYSNFEEIEREMRRAAGEKKDQIVAVYRVRIPYLDLDDRGFEIEKTKVFIYIMLYTAMPFPTLDRVDYISIGDKKFAAPQSRRFPEIYFTEKEFDELEDGAEITGDYNNKFGKLDKKAIANFPIVEARRKK